jgi:hypothetical protein
MKIFSGEKKLNAASARNCFLVNQFATPGLGSLMGGRIVAGLGQLLLSILGFALVMVWFLRTMKEYYSLMTEDITEVSYAKYALAGALFFAAAWLWSLLTSISMIRQAKEEAPPSPPAVPPRITNRPQKM